MADSVSVILIDRPIAPIRGTFVPLRQRIRLSQGFAKDDGRRDGDIERAHAGLHRDPHPLVHQLLQPLRHTATFLTAKKDIVLAIGQMMMKKSGASRQQHESLPPCPSIVVEGRKIKMADHRRPIEIIEPGPSQRPLGKGKAAGFDDMDRCPKAGARPDQGARILRNIGLEERDIHDQACPDQEDSIETSTPSIAMARGQTFSGSVAKISSSSAGQVSQAFSRISCSS